MVNRSLLKALLSVLLTAAAIFSAAADGIPSMELGISSLILQSRDADDGKYWGWTTAGTGTFSFKSTGNKNVKADLAISIAFPEANLVLSTEPAAAALSLPMLSIDRAFVKSRFPHFRLTAGKTRLGWGDGFVFNSGDVIFGSTDTAVDLTAAEVRTDTRWLTSLNIPLGRFSFIEGLVMPQQADTAAGLFTGRLDEASAGGRLYSKLGGIKIEGGYFFDQSETGGSGDILPLHKPYLGFQGNLFADWYLSSAVSLPAGSSTSLRDSAEDSLNISGGLFYLHQLNSISTLTFRIEGLYRPFQSWTEVNRTPGDDEPVYALMLYPEIGFTPADTLSLTARAIWSPVDSSAIITAGAGWNVFEGFDLSLYALFNAGDPDDNFPWNKAPELWESGIDVMDGAAIVIGLNYIY